MVAYNESLVNELWESDAANTLTNQAARRIEALEEALETLLQEAIEVNNGNLAEHTETALNAAMEALGNDS